MINVDASVSQGIQLVGIGVVPRNENLGSTLSSFQVQHCRRSANEVAHILALHLLLQGVSVVHKEYCPLYVSKSVKLDLDGV